MVTKVRAKTNRRGATTFLRFIFLLNKHCYSIIFSSMAGDRARPFFQQKFLRMLVSHWLMQLKGCTLPCPSRVPCFQLPLSPANEAQAFCCQKTQSYSAFGSCSLLFLSLPKCTHFSSLLQPIQPEAQACFPSLLSNSACVGVSAVGRQTVHCS